MKPGYLDVCPEAVIQKTTNVFERARGLIGRTLPPQTGLWIEPCNSVHTFFMRYPIDVIFIDSQGYIKKIVRDLRPNSVAVCFGASVVLEVRSSEAEAMSFEKGLCLKWLPLDAN